MGDLVSGFIGVGIEKVIAQILHHISIAVRYKNELGSLENLVISIQPMITQLQQYRPALNRNNGNPISQCFNKASGVSRWLKKLDVLLQQASRVVQQCAIPKYKFISRYQSSTRITGLISDIREHLQLSPLVQLAQIPELVDELKQTIKESLDAALASSSSSTCTATTSHPLASTGFFISEPLIVGQDKAFATLEKLVIDVEFSRVGVVGKGGSGKTLLFKTIFNSENVRSVFGDGLMLWLTISQSPSLTSLRSELSSQIAMQLQTNVDLAALNRNEEVVKVWLHENMQSKRFALFLDDVWGEGARLLEELGVPHLIVSSKVIMSSRDHRVLLEMGISAETSTIKMEDLIKDDSWRLFTHHAFPYNNGEPSATIDQGTAKLVCAKCGGLPLAIKVVGRAMAGIADAKEWELAEKRLPNAKSQERKAVYDCLQLSYDALARYDVNLQLCFLYSAAAFPEDQVVAVEVQLLPLWLGEGLLATKMPHHLSDHDPFEMGRIYINLLADRCLIEPTVRDIDGRLVCFRMHDVLRDFGIQIAEREEGFYCGVGRHLTTLDKNECSACTRMLLRDNDLSSFPESVKAQEICSLLVDNNINITEIPNRVMTSMISLRSLDLGKTSLQSLPKSVGCLKQLVILSLTSVPMTRLPASITNLVSLESLDVRNSKITELPYDIHKLISLKYLRLSGCEDLQYLPCSISKLTSLQHLEIDCSGLWTKCDQKKRGKKMASINDLGSLTQLKMLFLQNKGETVGEGIFGSMVQMETLKLSLTGMKFLPKDMSNMPKLRRLQVTGFDGNNMGSNLCEFQNLSKLRLWGCPMLEELPYLHKLVNLRQLEIIRCPKLKKLPKEFGETEAFSKLEIFSLAFLDGLEELPIIEEGALLSLQMFNIMMCKVLSKLPESYLGLKNLKKIRLYGSSLILECLENIEKKPTKIEVITMSMKDTIFYYNIWYPEIRKRGLGDLSLNSELGNNEFFCFLTNLIYT